MRKQTVREAVIGVAVAAAVLTFLLGFSPAIAWVGRTFLGY